MERPETVRRTRRSKKNQNTHHGPCLCACSEDGTGGRNWSIIELPMAADEWTDRVSKKKRRKHRLPMKMESEISDGRQGKGNERKRTMNTMRTPQLGNNGRGHEFLNNNQLIDPSGCKTIDIRCIRLLSTLTRCRP
jgi:hypothetical protein